MEPIVANIDDVFGEVTAQSLDAVDQGDNGTDNEDELIQRTHRRVNKVKIVDDDDESDDDLNDQDQINTNSKDSSDLIEADKNDETMESSGSENQSPPQSKSGMKFDKELFDAEDSSDGEGSGMPEAGENGVRGGSENESERLEEQMDPKLLKKLQKMKGAAKKPREQKSRKCKPTKDEMLQLHSETQRLIRESHVHLPYHKPEPKSLKDFMERARKKQEVYRLLKGARDIEKAQVIQDQIAGAPPVRLPKLRAPKGHSHRQSSSVVSRSQRSTALPSSQVSCPDSGHVSGVSMDMDHGDSQQATSLNSQDSSGLPDVGEDELPDLVQDSGSHNLNSISQHTVCKDSCKTSAATYTDYTHPHLAVDTLSESGSVTNSQVVEEYDSQSTSQASRARCTSQASQEIEESESLPPKGVEQQSLGDAVQSVPDSLYDESGTSLVNMVLDQDCNALSTATRESCDESDSIRCETDLSSGPGDGHDNICDQNSTVDLHHGDDCGEARDEDSGSVKADSSLHVKECDAKVVPKLSRGDGDLIILDDSNEQHNPRSKGVSQLMARLLQQNKKNIQGPSANVQISIVEKEGDDGAPIELRLKTVNYQMDTEDKPALDLRSCAPGGRLQALKKRLEVGMQQRRTAAYARRQQQFQMENEEGFGDGDDDGLPDDGEEEAELTDASDTDDDNNENDVDADEDVTDRHRRKENPFVDQEAEESDESWHEDNDSDDRGDDDAASADDDGDDDDNDEGSDDDDRGDEAGEEEGDLFGDSEELRLRLDSSDEEDERVTGTCRKSGRVRQLAISDDEEEEETKTASVQQTTDAVSGPPATPEDKSKVADLSYESDGLTPMTRLLQDTQPTFGRNRVVSTAEDSQDLYGGSESDHNNSVVSQTPHGSISDDMSQILDADGYLRVATLKAKPTAGTLKVQDSQATEEVDMDDIAGLCSGQFVESSVSEGKGLAFRSVFDGDSQDDRESLTSLFGGSSQAGLGLDKDKEDMSQSSMGELLGLCSGQFPASNSATQGGQTESVERRGVKRRLDVEDGVDIESGTGEFQILSDDEASRDTEQLSEVEGETEDAYNSDECKENGTFKGFKQKGKLLREFVEDEAELSGSEAESDENDDVAEEDDYLEMEEGDNDVNMTDDQLRDEVGRVHMKHLMDDDDRELMRYKEMYLPDGDLHSEGAGRQRRFHWKNMEDGSQQDLFADGSDEEKEGEDLDEKQWRMQRFEREKFLEEQQGQEEEETDSQLLQFGKFFMKRQVSDPSGVTETTAVPKPAPVRSQSLAVEASPVKFIKPKIPKRGSFLSRSKESLAKIAEINKPSSLNVNGTRGSRNFVFQVLSDKPENGATDKDVPVPPKPAPVKAAIHKQPAKKKCLEPRSTRPQKSIFKLLEK